ncbi:MAG: hypothetical protein NTV52_22815 [Acidobacteria bacterium]|nr:hypothetical protein [Acidobacteriota bacterium]
MSGVRVALFEGGVGPGAAIDGKVTWDRRELHPTEVEIRLVWHTTGAVDRDQGTRIVGRFPVAAGVGELAFSIVAPDGPYSFSGKLLSIVWTLEAVVGPGSAQVPLVIGPGGREVVVGKA